LEESLELLQVIWVDSIRLRLDSRGGSWPGLHLNTNFIASEFRLSLQLLKELALSVLELFAADVRVGDLQ